MQRSICYSFDNDKVRIKGGEGGFRPLPDFLLSNKMFSLAFLSHYLSLPPSLFPSSPLSLSLFLSTHCLINVLIFSNKFISNDYLELRLLYISISSYVYNVGLFPHRFFIRSEILTSLSMYYEDKNFSWNT